MTRHYLLYIQDILDSINLIQQYTKGMDEEDFEESQITQDAVQWRIGVIGEAMKNLPKEYRALEEGIEWEEAISMRNVILHEYFSVSSHVVWETVKEDISRLQKKMEVLLKKLKTIR